MTPEPSPLNAADSGTNEHETSETRTKRKNDRRGLLSVAAGNWGNSALQLVAGLLLARGLTPDDRGTVALAMVWPAVGLVVGGLGIRNSVAYFTARDPDHKHEWLSSALTLAAISTATIVSAGMIISRAAVDDSDLRSGLTIILLSTPLALTTGAFRGFLVSFGLARWALVRAVQPATYAASVVLFYVTGTLTVQTACLAFLLSLLAACGAATHQALTIAKPTARAVSRDRARELVRYGVKSSLSNTAEMVNVRVDVAVLGLLLTADEVGIYAVAAGLSMYVVPLSNAAAPWLFVQMARQDRDSTRALSFRRAVGGTAVVATALALAAAVAGPPLLPLLIGDGWADSVTPLRVLLAASVVRSVNFVVASSANGLGLPTTGGLGEAVGAVITIALIYPLITWLGVVGAAVASLAAYTASCTTMLAVVRRHLQPVDEEAAQ